MILERGSAGSALRWRDDMRARATSLVPPMPSPTSRADLVQVVKAVIGGVLAWVLARDVLGLQDAFMAPWAALLTVHATVYRSFSRGSQAVIAAVIGVLLSFGVVAVTGLTAVSLGIALLVGMLLGRVPPIRDEGSTVAATALFIITTGQADEIPALAERLASTGIGVGVGLLVNVLVFAPLDPRTPRLQIDAICRGMGGLLGDMARELAESGKDVDSEHWIKRTRRLDERLQQAWRQQAHSRDSRVGNPRRRSRQLTPDDDAAILLRLEEGVTHTRSLARTINEANQEPDEWDARFRQAWPPLLESLGDRIASPDSCVVSVRPELESLVGELSGDYLPGDHWPVYGSLIQSTLSIVDVVDDVASSRHARA